MLRPTPESIPPSLEEAVEMVFSELRVERSWRYVMTGEIRLLLFWVGRDDVGDGHIRLARGVDRPELEAIRLRIGSDPEKAPRAINRWGAATEMVERRAGGDGGIVSSAFFGFMKATEGETLDAVESELARDDGRHVFEASINRVEPGVARSAVLPIVSPVDFHLRQLEEAERMVSRQYREAFPRSRYRQLDGALRARCDSTLSFLFAVKDLVEAAVDGQGPGTSRCLVYNSTPYGLRVAGVEAETVAYELADGTPVEHGHRDLLDLRFELESRLTGGVTGFELLVGTRGELRGVPVRITYQPNFWFRVILHLHEATHGPRAALTRAR